jgi:hypothetical protein
MNLVPDGVPGPLAISGTVSVYGIENFLLQPDAVVSLVCNPLLQLYADGLRANTAESKFFHWFIILEEFLEKSSKLNEAFEPLFNETDKDSVRAVGETLGGRKKNGLMNALQLTRESRKEKLAAILARLGITTVQAAGTKAPITPQLCDALITQRNALFHRGAHIDEKQLYEVLFPIVTALAGRSEEIMSLRQSATQEHSAVAGNSSRGRVRCLIRVFQRCS